MLKTNCYTVTVTVYLVMVMLLLYPLHIMFLLLLLLRLPTLQLLLQRLPANRLLSLTPILTPIRVTPMQVIIRTDMPTLTPGFLSWANQRSSLYQHYSNCPDCNPRAFISQFFKTCFLWPGTVFDLDSILSFLSSIIRFFVIQYQFRVTHYVIKYTLGYWLPISN